MTAQQRAIIALYAEPGTCRRLYAAMPHLSHRCLNQRLTHLVRAGHLKIVRFEQRGGRTIRWFAQADHPAPAASAPQPPAARVLDCLRRQAGPVTVAQVQQETGLTAHTLYECLYRLWLDDQVDSLSNGFGAQDRVRLHRPCPLVALLRRPWMPLSLLRSIHGRAWL